MPRAIVYHGRGRYFHSMRIFLFLLFNAQLLAVAAPHYRFSENCKQAAAEIFKLRLDRGRDLLEQEKKSDPDNLIPLLLEDYIDFFKVYISEDELLYYRLSDRRNERLKRLVKGPKESPFYRYCLAEVQLHWGIARLKFEEYIGAFMNVKKAYALLEANRKAFPGFVYNLKSLAVMHTVVGAIPKEYRWGVEKLGFEGSIETGMAEMEKVVKYCRHNDFPFHPEVKMLQAFLKLHLLQDGAGAWALVSDPGFGEADDLLACFTKASVASYTGHNDAVIRIIEERPRGEAYFEIPFLEYLEGLALVHKLDPRGEKLLLHFIENFKGRNYIKAAWQKIAWLRLTAGDNGGYHDAMSKVLNDGFGQIEEDRAAQQEAEAGVEPDPRLLKSRLLFDGGYYEKALQTLSDFRSFSFTLPAHILEFNYRMGRIYQKRKEDKKALLYFERCIRASSHNSPFYFAANACLQIALMAEEAGERKKARSYFQKAMQYHNHTYRKSIESQARAGLERLKS